MTLIDTDQICSLLPHRPPFLFAKEVSVNHDSKSGTALLCFDDMEEFWNNNTQINVKSQSDVLLLEAAAQVFGVILASQRSSELTVEEDKHLLLGFDNVDYHGHSVVSGLLELHVWLKQEFNNMFRGEFTAKQHGLVAVKGELTVMQGAAN